jgi:hypothetical protein
MRLVRFMMIAALPLWLTGVGCEQEGPAEEAIEETEEKAREKAEEAEEEVEEAEEEVEEQTR